MRLPPRGEPAFGAFEPAEVLHRFIKQVPALGAVAWGTVLPLGDFGEAQSFEATNEIDDIAALKKVDNGLEYFLMCGSIKIDRSQKPQYGCQSF